MMATGATGGVSVVAGVAAEGAAAAAAGLAGTVSGIRGVAKILEALGVSGGFPQRSIERIADFSYCKDNISRVAESVLGDKGFRKAEISWGPMGREYPAGEKICFSDESILLDLLRCLPPDVPVMDLLGDDIFACVSSEHRTDGHNYFTLSRDKLEKARAVLQPLCKETTTARELVRRFETYFIKLARHAVEHPEDFDIVAHTPFYLGGWPSCPEEVQAHSYIQDLTRVFYRFENHAGEAENIREDLNQAVEKHKKISRDKLFDYLEHRRKNDPELPSAYGKGAKIRLKEYLKRLEKPLQRDVFPVELVPGEDGKCVVVNGITKAVPTRMDWLHWVQTLDPQGAKASDVAVECQGRLITVRNQSALKDIMNRATGHSAVRVFLPNRRMGFDLNQPEPPAPLTA